MKIDRLIGILSILLQQDKVTAPVLADKFEVSRRTISRDIEDLCKAGIPIVTAQGQNGGISIMDGYRMDKTLLTNSDMQAILAGLKSLDSVCKTSRYQQLMDKIQMGSSTFLPANNHIVINLASWYKSSLAPKVELIQTAIEHRETVSFIYYSPREESRRTIEPYLLVFQWSSWYVWGYCLKKKDFRMFKLNRLHELETAGETFTPRETPAFNPAPERVFPVTIQAVARFHPSMKWRLIEEFGFESFVSEPEGTLLFRFGFADKENLFSWILGFGDAAELLSPALLREELALLTKKLADRYRQPAAVKLPAAGILHSAGIQNTDESLNTDVHSNTDESFNSDESFNPAKPI